MMHLRLTTTLLLLLLAGLFFPSIVTTACRAQTPEGTRPADTIRIRRASPITIEDLRRLRDSGLVRSEPASPEVYEAERLMAEDRYEEAVELLEPIWREDPHDEATSTALKKALRGLKNHDGLIAVLRRQLEGREQDGILLSELAGAFFTADRIDSARATLTRLVAYDAADPVRHRIAARAFVRAGRYTEGLDAYRRARIDLADSLAFAEDLARLLEARREYEAAVGEYFRWLAATPKASNTVQKKITNLIKIPEAAPQITAALHTIVLGSPDNEYAHRLYGDLLFESGAVDSAFTEYRRADVLAPAPGAHRLSGINRCLETGNMRTARDEAAAFLADYPQHQRRADVHVALAKAELGLGRPQVAIDLLRRLSEQIPHPRERARIDYQIGDIYRLYTEQMDSARVLFERVIDVASRGTAERTRSLLRLADIAVYYGDLAAADSACERAAESAPRNLKEEVSFYRAVLLFLSGAYAESAAQLKDLVKQFPRGLYVNDAIALNLIVRDGNDAMGWSLDRYAGAQLALRRGQPDSALALFAILAADSVNALADDAQFAAAGVYTEAGDFEAALTSYQAVITLFPESPLVPQTWMAIGNLYADALGDGAAARSAYQTVISNFKESPVVETARHRLQRLEVP